MRALVTGATGFVGRHLVLALRSRGWDVVCLVRRPVEPCDSAIRCIHGDLLQPSSLSLRDAGAIDVLFHFGAQLPAKDVAPGLFQTANCDATIRLLQASEESTIKSVVYASSLPVIGAPQTFPITEDHPVEPTHPYHRSKLCGENACENERKAHARSITSLRITSPYGPGMASTVLAKFAKLALRNEPVQWLGNGARAQNFVHVSDVVHAALLAAETNQAGVFNIGGAETTTMRHLAELAVRLAENGSASSAGGTDPEEGVRWEIDLTRSGAELGYRPKISLHDGLRDYIAWLKSGAEPPRWWKS